MVKIKSVYNGEVLNAYDVRRDKAGDVEAVRATCFKDGRWAEVTMQLNDERTQTCVVNFVPAEVVLVERPAAEKEDQPVKQEEKPSGETSKKKRVK